MYLDGWKWVGGEINNFIDNIGRLWKWRWK
jgi:hypothetical protein